MLGGSRRSSGVGVEETKALQGRQQRHPPAQQEHSAVSSLSHPDLPTPKIHTTRSCQTRPEKGEEGAPDIHEICFCITVVLDDETWYITVVLNKGMIKCSSVRLSLVKVAEQRGKEHKSTYTGCFPFA